MNVLMMAKTMLTTKFFMENDTKSRQDETLPSGNQCVALTAIRNCYSPLKPSEILAAEGEKYFGDGGKEGKRLFNQIVKSGHTSTLEHIHFVFIVEDLSRAALAQLTRHRHYGFSVKSQRYVKYGSNDKTEGFEYVMPESVKKGVRDLQPFGREFAEDVYEDAMTSLQNTYDLLRQSGVPAEDARMILPNAATTHLVMSGNLRTVLDFYSKRRKGKGAQWEIADLAEIMRELVEEEEPWTKDFFGQ